jgi:signal transduction histidine kinase
MWVPFGPDEDMWLVTLARPPLTPDSMAVAVRAKVAFEDGVVLGRRRDALFEPLGSSFPELFVRVPAQPVADRGSVRSVLAAVVCLTLAIALSGSWFFWRDVQRDLRLAELRSQFVASVSHELKTPLTAIRMFAETLRLGRAPRERTTEYLDTIVSESERLTRLLNNVLDFSKVEQGTRRYQLTQQPLAPIVQSAARTMRYALEQDGFDLRVTIEDAHLTARCDADALEQAILNLLSNAMKYSGASRFIALRLRAAEKGAAIAVSDRGIGIPAAEQPRVFEKFFRGSDDAHQRVAGTGLGLTLVEHTVRAHGGRVDVASRLGEGSTFTILLPTTQSNDLAAAPQASVLPAHAASRVIES